MMKLSIYKKEEEYAEEGRVEYRLTDIRHSLVPFIVQLTEWAQTNMKTIVRHRKKFEAEQVG